MGERAKKVGWKGREGGEGKKLGKGERSKITDEMTAECACTTPSEAKFSPLVGNEP